MTSLSVHQLATLGFWVVSLFCLSYALAAAPSGEAERLGLRGLKRQRALATSGLWSKLEPVVRWLGRGLRGWLSPGMAALLNAKITLAGDYLGLVAEEFVALSVVTSVGGGVVGFALGRFSGLGPLLALVGFAYGCAAPYFAMTGARAARLERMARRMPHVIDLLALGSGAGLDFPRALRQVVEKAGDPEHPLIEELSLILQALQLGRTRVQALEEFAARATCVAVIEFVNAMVQGELRGTPIASVLQIQAEVARRQRSVRAEEAATRASGMLMIPLFLVFVCVMLLVAGPMILTLTGQGL